MATQRRKKGHATAQDDLFAAGRVAQSAHALDRLPWPSQGAVPVNRASAHVRDVVWTDLVASRSPLLVAGFSSLAEVVRFVAEWDLQAHSQGEVRLLLGTEPFSGMRRSFGSPRAVFTDEVRRYWLEELGVSLRLSAKIVQTIAAVDRGAPTNPDASAWWPAHWPGGSPVRS